MQIFTNGFFFCIVNEMKNKQQCEVELTGISEIKFSINQLVGNAYDEKWMEVMA